MVTQHFICYTEEKRIEERRSCDYIYIIDIIGPGYVWGDREIGEGAVEDGIVLVLRRENQSV